MIARLQKQADERLARLKEVETKLHDPDTVRNQALLRDLGKELRELHRVRDLIEQLRSVESHLGEARHVAEDGTSDAELRKMAEAEVFDMERQLERATAELEDALVKKDPILAKNAIIEIRAGTGGLEASLFAAEIFRMYTKYAQSQGFKVEVFSQSATEAGGVREVIFSVAGEGVFGPPSITRGGGQTRPTRACNTRHLWPG